MDCFNSDMLWISSHWDIQTEWLMMTDWLILSSASPGWQILAEKEEEQLGCQTFPWCSQVKGEPNHCESSLSGAWECSTADRGRRATEGMRALQERRRPLQIQIWEVVRGCGELNQETVKWMSIQKSYHSLCLLIRCRLMMASVLTWIGVRQVDCSILHIWVRWIKSELLIKCRNKHFKYASWVGNICLETSVSLFQ